MQKLLIHSSHIPTLNLKFPLSDDLWYHATDSLQVLFSPPTKESSSSSMTVNTASVTSSPGRVTAAALTGGRCTSNATAKRRRWNQAEEAALVAAVQSVFAATVVAAGAVALADAPSIGDLAKWEQVRTVCTSTKPSITQKWNAKEIRDRWKKLQGKDFNQVNSSMISAAEVALSNDSGTTSIDAKAAVTKPSTPICLHKNSKIDGHVIDDMEIDDLI